MRKRAEHCLRELLFTSAESRTALQAVLAIAAVSPSSDSDTTTVDFLGSEFNGRGDITVLATLVMGGYEHRELDALCGLLEDGSTFLDVSVNVGSSAILGSQTGSGQSCRIRWAEPPDPLLERNLNRLSGCVAPFS